MIKLTKNKINYSNDFNPECGKYIEKEVKFLLPHLNETVELSDDFTLGDLFSYIEKEKDIFDIVFSSHLGHYSLQSFVDEIKKPLEVNLKILLNGPEDEIDYLEIQRCGEYWDGDIELYIDFHGINGKEDIGYAIEFTPLNELKHLPLRLNEDFSVTEDKIPSRIVMYLARLLRKIGILRSWHPFFHICVKGKTNFTVYELISSVLYEISFVGSPEERNVRWLEFEKDIEEMKNLIVRIDHE